MRSISCSQESMSETAARHSALARLDGTHPVEFYDISVCRELQDLHGHRDTPVEDTPVNLHKEVVSSVQDGSITYSVNGDQGESTFPNRPSPRRRGLPRIPLNFRVSKLVWPAPER